MDVDAPDRVVGGCIGGLRLARVVPCVIDLVAGQVRPLQAPLATPSVRFGTEQALSGSNQKNDA